MMKSKENFEADKFVETRELSLVSEAGCSEKILLFW